MLLILFIITLCQSFGASTPIIPNDLRDEPPLTAPSSLQEQNLRTRFDIIWTCASTLFICTWVAIHPNIPPRGESAIRSLGRRIKLMVLTLVVPELILIWAYKQWAAARYLAGAFKDDGWTPVHGHFLVMGGFILVRRTDEIVLDCDLFLYYKLEFDFPTITAAEINDKSRGDFLSKTIVILQSAWFIIQCIARGIQGIAVTELELVTLATDSCTTSEPLKKIVDRPGRRIQFEADLRAPSQRSFVQKFIFHPLRRMLSLISRFIYHSILSSYDAALSSIRSLQSIINRYLEKGLGQIRRTPGSEYLWFLYLPIYLAFTIPVVTVVWLTKFLVEIADTKQTDDGAVHVPTFYAPREGSDEIQLFFILTILATIFGSLHLIAWQFHFPTHIERLLWQIGSITITTVPSLLFIGPIIDKFDPDSFRDITRTTLQGIITFVVMTGLVGYMLARLLLITQAVVLLRKQPESAFYAINWTSFLPHI